MWATLDFFPRCLFLYPFLYTSDKFGWLFLPRATPPGRSSLTTGAPNSSCHPHPYREDKYRTDRRWTTKSSSSKESPLCRKPLKKNTQRSTLSLFQKITSPSNTFFSLFKMEEKPLQVFISFLFWVKRLFVGEDIDKQISWRVADPSAAFATSLHFLVQCFQFFYRAISMCAAHFLEGHNIATILRICWNTPHSDLINSSDQH